MNPHPRDDDGVRFVVMIHADGGDKLFNVYLDADRATAEASRLRALGLDARVAEGRRPMSGEMARRYRGRRA
jgi:hypothetical protein